ncbi:MAG: cation diffusion facilitator family transporter [bacterium]
MKRAITKIIANKKPGGPKPREPHCEKCARQIGWINLSASIVVTALRVAIGILSRSSALLTSSFYSFTNAGAALIIIIARKISAKPVDREHPFGHGKAEFIAIFFLSALSMIGLLCLTVTSLNVLVNGIDSPPHWIAAAVAIVSIIAGRLLYSYTTCVGKNLNSPAITTQAEHIHSDTVGNIAVMAGVIGARLGFYFMDPLAALFEVVHLILLIRRMFFFAVSGLMDHAIDRRKVQQIERYAAGVPGVRRVNRMRARQIGQMIWVDLDIALDGDLNVIEGNKIIEKVKKAIIGHVSHVGNITVGFAPAERMEKPCILNR